MPGSDAVPPPRRRLPWPQAVAHGCLAGCLLVAGICTAQGTLGGNFHTVIPGRVYRCAQPSPEWLEEVVRRYDVRTVINLRGDCAPMDWYLDECRVTHRLNISMEDVSMSACRLPSVYEVRRLVEVLDHCEYPVLFHCFRGADRTGLASAIAQLLHTDAGLGRAWRQLGLVYGHVPFGKPAQLDRFFELYADWLEHEGAEHSPDRFRHWVGREYCPGECRCAMELLGETVAVPRGVPGVVNVRVRNTSIETWRLQAGSNAGIHAAFSLYDDRRLVVVEGRAGLFDAEVRPGESIDLTLVVPAVARPGRYRLVVDMIDHPRPSCST